MSLAVCNGPVSLNAVMKSVTAVFAVSNVLAAVSRTVSRKSVIGLSSSMLKASRSSALKLPSLTRVITPFRPVVALPLNAVIFSAATPMAEVTAGFTRSKASVRPPTTDASRLPIAPSMVLVLVAASLATSLMPSWISAWLNSSAVISPLAIASLKLPVYAPLASMASWSLPEAPGMASASWFQFSAVSLPAPAVWVSIIATDLNVSELPPATALRLPAASVSSV